MLLARPRFRKGVLFSAAYYFAFGAISTAAPFVLIVHFGLSHVQFGAAFALIGVCFAIGGVVGPRLMRIATQAGLLDAAAGLAIAAGLLLLALATSRADSVATVLLCLGVFGLAFGIALSVGAALALSDAGDAAGTASSLSGCLQVGAAALGSVVANLTHRGSVAPLSFFLLFAGLAALCAVWRMDDRNVVGGR
jgi:DHA1 family bicyclomycin/chloramphenicol resistance-like MFS transporter